jgi:hypothetical protein
MLACVVLALVSASCTTEVDYTLGSEFVPTKQNMELKRRVYRMGEWKEGDNSESCQLLTTRLYQTDSIASSNIESGYFGAERSDIYGERRAGFMTQMIFGVTLGEERGWGYRPIFDSMVLALYVHDFHGDTTKHHKFNVYEITSNDYITSAKDKKDSTFYINFDPTPYISSEPIFTFEYPNQDRGIYVGDVEEPRSCRIKLDNTAATREYVSRLMFTTNLDATGGYAYDSDSLYVAANEEKFIKQVRGVYIAPADDAIEGEGAMFATDLENSALILYARSRYEEDPTIIRDTAQMLYNFYINPAERDLKVGNVSINRVSHDFVGSKVADVESNAEVSVGYVDGMGGVVTEVWFSDEFIQSLADIALSEKDAVISVNQARLKVYLEGSDYDPLNIDPIAMSNVMNNAMERMGLYTSYGSSFVGITDYAYTHESSNALDYDGYLNRSLSAYSMDISTYIQSLIMAAQENVDENGKVQLEKFSAEYEPEAESLVGYRRMYLGPEAAARFGFNRQAVYGGDGAVEGVAPPAPITLDLTYTIVR